MSYLTTRPMKALADALSALGGPADAHLTMGEAEMLARVHTILAAPVSHLTTSRNALLAGIRNAIVGGDISSLTSSDTAILADVSGVSRLMISPGDLWDRAMNSMGGAPIFALLAEDNTRLQTEAGDNLVTEDRP